MALLIRAEKEAGTKLQRDSIPARHQIVPVVLVPRHLGNHTDVIPIGRALGAFLVVDLFPIKLQDHLVPQWRAILVRPFQFQLTPDSIPIPC